MYTFFAPGPTQKGETTLRLMMYERDRDAENLFPTPSQPLRSRNRQTVTDAKERETD